MIVAVGIAGCSGVPTLSATVLRPPPGPAIPGTQVPIELRVAAVGDDGLVGPARPLAIELTGLTIVELWATWCHPCREAMPATAALAEELRPHGVRWMPVSMDDNPAAVVAYLASLGLEATPLVATSVEAWRGALGVDALPMTIVVDSESQIVASHRGFDDSTVAALRHSVYQAL